MPRFKQFMLQNRYMEQANDGSSGGSGGGGDAAAVAAAALAAEAEAAAAAAALAKAGTKPSDAEAKLLKDVMRQKEATAAAKAEAEALRKLYEGIDPDKARAQAVKAADDERKAAEARGEYDRILAQVAATHKVELAAAAERAGVSNASVLALQQQVADLTVGSAFSASTLVKDDLTLTSTKARVIFGTHFEFKEGRVIGYDKPAGASDRTPLVDSTGQALSFDEALSRIVEADPDRDSLRRSKMKQGAGSGSNPGAKQGQAAGEATKLDGAARIARGLKALNLSK